jgi:hypothetical protein
MTPFLRSMKPHMIANSHNVDPSGRSQQGPAWADAWHLWTVIAPRRSIAGRLVWGTVWRRSGGCVGSTRNSSSIWMMIFGTASVIATNNPPLILAHFPLERQRHSTLQTSMRYFFRIFYGPEVFPDEVGNTFSRSCDISGQSHRCRTMQGRRALLAEFGVRVGREWQE